jgi:hypothetical protein
MSTTTSPDATYWAALSARFEAEAARAWTGITERATGVIGRTEPIQTGAGIALTVTLLRYPLGTAEEAVIANTAAPEYAELTEDGRYARWQEWETGPGSGREVYYERWEDGVRVAHGWLDAVSRKLVQSG